MTASPSPCSTCHRTEDTEDEWARVKGVYGYGTGEFMLENPHGPQVDALQMIDDDGNLLTERVHERHGPVPADARERALAVEVDERGSGSWLSSPAATVASTRPPTRTRAPPRPTCRTSS